MASLMDGFTSLFAPINKTRGASNDDDLKDGLIVSYQELDLDISDEDLRVLKNEYEASWVASDDFTRVMVKGDKNEKFWMGKRETNDTTELLEKNPYIENIVFEAVESFIPIATQKNPDPLVKTDNTPEMQELAGKITSFIVFLADINKLTDTIQTALRNWLNRYIGIIKIGWDNDEQEIVYKATRPTCIMLDPRGYIQGGEYFGEFIGEKKEDKARDLIIRFPKQKEYITLLCNGKMGSIMKYTEWWTKDYIFFTLNEEILSKARHPHWNYKGESTTVDDYGSVIPKDVPEKNHFKTRKFPYAFLSVFSLQKSPVDEVTLIEQGIAFQNLINERGKQLTKNIRATNAGAVVSGQYFTKEQAAQVSDALREGRTVWVPTGDVNAAYKRDVAPSLPDYVYTSMEDYRNRFLDIFGVRGSTPQGTATEDSVRGKIITGNQDSSRIGGGITNHIESMVSYLYNYSVQMMYVYYDFPHSASIIGPNGAAEFTQLSSLDFPIDRRFFVGVQAGSLVPKSPLLQRNEAMDLWAAGATDPVNLYKDLKDPNPEERAKELFLWKTAPQLLFGGDPSQLPMTPNDGTAVQEPIAPAGQGQKPPSATVDPINQVPLPQV